MKKIIILLALGGLPLRLLSQKFQTNPEFLYFQPYKTESPKVALNVYSGIPVFGKHWGLGNFLYAEGEDTARWGEATIGPAYFSEYIEGSLMGGWEMSPKNQKGSGVRMNFYFFVHAPGDKFSLLLFYEYGHSEPFARIEGQWLVLRSRKKTEKKEPIWKFSAGIASHGSDIGETGWFYYRKWYVFMSPVMWNWEIGKPLSLVGIGADFR